MDEPKNQTTKASSKFKVTPNPLIKKTADKSKGATAVSLTKTLAPTEVSKKVSIEKVKSPTTKPKVPTPQKTKATPLSPEKKKIASPTKKEEPKLEKSKNAGTLKTSNPESVKTKPEVPASTKASLDTVKNVPEKAKDTNKEESKAAPVSQRNQNSEASVLQSAKNGNTTSKDKPSEHNGETKNKTPKEQNSATKNKTPKEQNSATKNKTSAEQKVTTKNKTPAEQNGTTRSKTPAEQNGTTRSKTPAEQNGTTRSKTPAEQNGTTKNITPAEQNGTTRSKTPAEQNGTTRSKTPAEQNGTTRSKTPAEQNGTTKNITPAEQNSTTRSKTPAEQNGTTRSKTPDEQNGTAKEEIPAEQKNKHLSEESPTGLSDIKDKSKIQNLEDEKPKKSDISQDQDGEADEEEDEESEDEALPPKPAEKKPDYSKPIGPVKDPIEYNDIVGIVKEAIQEFDSVDAINAAFANCKTDAERFKLLYSNPVIYDAIDVEDGYKKKDLETAAKYRTEGNEVFKAKRHVKALELYSLCIINAPLPKGDESPELALGFANRSAVLYHLSHYLLCVQDIKLALKHQYPEKMQYKLYDRLGRCYYFLRQKDEAISAFETGMEALDNAGLDARKHESLENDMIKQLMKTRKIKAAKLTKTVKEFNYCHGTMPIIGLPSEEIPVMAETLVLKYSPERGRGIYTTKDIEAGELLVLEKPFASKTMHNSDLTHCQNCLNRVLSPLPCDQCSGVVFCCEECKTEAMKGFHFAECRVLEAIHNIDFGLGHLALRMVLKAGLNHILQNNKKYPESFRSDILRIGFNKDGVYDSMDYDTVYSLVKHSEKRSLGDMFKRSVVAVFMVKCLEKTLSSQPLSTKAHLPEKCVIGGHILRHIQMLPCNAHEVSEFAYREFDLPNSQNVEIGSGIYATLSLINHSCDPNVVRHSYGDYCAVRAIRNIPKGTEIYDSYGALYPLVPRKDRQEKLLSQYFFKCTCKACMEKWPMYFQIPNEVPYFYCEKCSGYLSIPEDGKTQRAMCDRCRYVQDMTPKLDVWTRSDEIFSKKLKEIIGGVVTSDALSVLLGHLKTLDQLIIRPFADYNDCQEAIKQCLNLQANCKKVDLYI